MKKFSSLKNDLVCFLNDRKSLHTLVILMFLFGLLLSYFRSASGDETGYMREALLIAECIKKGVWFGDYSVGLHGFLFKLPVALVYIFTGPSVFIATLFNILISCITLILFYKFSNYFTKNNAWSLAATFVLACNFQFIITLPTFLRESVVLLATLLFFNALLENKSPWILGLAALLMLDAKEYAFFVLCPAYALWYFISNLEFKSILAFFVSSIKSMLKLIPLFIPSAVFLVLMFTTRLVPVNMFDAAIFRLTTESNWLDEDFEAAFATKNLMGSESRILPKINLEDQHLIVEHHSFITETIKNSLGSVNTFIGYFGKIFYPRSFSFLGCPMIMFVPAFIYSIKYYLTKLKEKGSQNDIKLSFVFMMWIYVLVFILRASITRYLYPALPVIILFFILFIKDGLKDKKFAVVTLFITLFMTEVNMYFETSFTVPKQIIDLIIFFLMLIVFYNLHLRSKFYDFSNTLLVLVLGVSTSIVALAFTSFQEQINENLKFGYNKELDAIISHISTDDIVWINNTGWDQLPATLRYDLSQPPEYQWKLLPSIPKSHMLKPWQKPITFDQPWDDPLLFKNFVYSMDINKIIVVESLIPTTPLINEESAKILLTQNWLKLEEKITLKNKNVYTFEVIK